MACQTDPAADNAPKAGGLEEQEPEKGLKADGTAWEQLPMEKLPPGHAYRWHCPSPLVCIVSLGAIMVWLIGVMILRLGFPSELTFGLGMALQSTLNYTMSTWYYAGVLKHSHVAKLTVFGGFTGTAVILLAYFGLGYRFVNVANLFGVVVLTIVALPNAKSGNRYLGLAMYVASCVVQMVLGLLVTNTPEILARLPEGPIRGLLAPLIKVIYLDLGILCLSRIWKCLYQPGTSCFVIMYVAAVMVTSIEAYVAVQFLAVRDLGEGIIFAVVTIMGEVNARHNFCKGLLWHALGQPMRNTFAVVGMNLRRCKLNYGLGWLPGFLSLAVASFVLRLDNLFFDGITWLLLLAWILVQVACDFSHVLIQRCLNPQGETLRQTYFRLLSPNGTKHFLGALQPSQPLSKQEQCDAGKQEMPDEDTQDNLDLDFRCFSVPMGLMAVLGAPLISTTAMMGALFANFDPCELVFPKGVQGC